MEYYLEALKKYAQFNGRANRSEYWYFILFHLLISIAIAIVDSVLGLRSKSSSIGLLGSIYSLGTFIPAVAVLVRRLHDTGRSGWWFFISLIPLVGSIILIVFLASAGQVGANLYG